MIFHCILQRHVKSVGIKTGTAILFGTAHSSQTSLLLEIIEAEDFAIPYKYNQINVYATGNRNLDNNPFDFLELYNKISLYLTV